MAVAEPDMHDTAKRPSEPEWKPACLIFAVTLVFYCIGLGWGLPNGNDTWAADAIKPGAPLSVMYRVFVAEPWNSGWFWFKYPMGHVLILATLYAPYVGFLFLTGGIEDPTSTFPYGMADPDTTLAVLALIGRAVSATMGAGVAAIAYLLVNRSFGRIHGWSAAAATALCYPMVFYSHTTNVEVPYTFWTMLAFLGAVRIAEGGARGGAWLMLGVGAAMAVSTKEIAGGFFLGLPVVLIAVHLLAARPFRDLVVGGLLAAAATAVTIVLANNVLWNPTGFTQRLAFLTHSLPEEVAAKYAPYYFPIDFEGYRGWSVELAQLGIAATRVMESLGLPTTALALIGLAIAAIKRPYWAAMAVAAAIGFYLVGVKAMLSLSVRYVLPVSVLGAVSAGIALGALLEGRQLRPLRLGIAVLAFVYIAVYGFDVSQMMVRDGRYRAEDWLAQNLGPEDSVETYQRPTYLPRFERSAHIERVAFMDRTINAFAERNPDYVVLSSAGISGITVKYKTDWQSDAEKADEWIPAQISVTGKVMNYNRRQNLEFLESLRSGKLGYSELARFQADPWIERPLMKSLNPEITIYGRSPATEAP